MDRKSKLAAWFFLPMAALTVGAQTTAPSPDRDARFNRALKRFDADGDGQLSQKELSSKPKMFARLDADHNGFVTREEFEAGAQRHQKRRLQAFEALDKNHDGQITRDEWTGSAESFDRLDLNHNGVITREEMEVRTKKKR